MRMHRNIETLRFTVILIGFWSMLVTCAGTLLPAEPHFARVIEGVVFVGGTRGDLHAIDLNSCKLEARVNAGNSMVLWSDATDRNHLFFPIAQYSLESVPIYEYSKGEFRQIADYRGLSTGGFQLSDALFFADSAELWVRSRAVGSHNMPIAVYDVNDARNAVKLSRRVAGPIGNSGASLLSDGEFWAVLGYRTVRFGVLRSDQIHDFDLELDYGQGIINGVLFESGQLLLLNDLDGEEYELLHYDLVKRQIVRRQAFIAERPLQLFSNGNIALITHRDGSVSVLSGELQEIERIRFSNERILTATISEEGTIVLVGQRSIIKVYLAGRDAQPEVSIRECE